MPRICGGITLFVGTIASLTVALSGLTPAIAQSVPSCSTSANGNFACSADLDGNGKQHIIVGSFQANNPGIGQGYGYVFILTPAGTVRRRVCWTQGANQPTALCPTVISRPPD
jgi:hypothetical protein